MLMFNMYCIKAEIREMRAMVMKDPSKSFLFNVYRGRCMYC